MTYTIAVDVDDVVLDLMPKWLSWYNLDFDDNLRVDDITDWDITKFVKEEAKDKIYNYVRNKEVFESACPVVSAWAGIEYFKLLKHRVIFVTANNPQDVKYQWLFENGFVDRTEDFVVAKDKSLIFADYMIDDSYDNVRSFCGERAWLMTKPWNAKFNWNYRVNNWSQIVTLLASRSFFE